jgi:mannosyltransferase
MDNQPTSHRKVDPALAVIALLSILALVLRLRHLGDASFWFDEGASVQFATMPVGEWLRFLWHGEANMLPYYLLLRAWMLLGHSEATVRLLSVLFATATVPLVYRLAWRSSGVLAGTIAAGLLAVHGFHVSYSQEARSYSMVVFLLSASWLALTHLVESDSRRARWIYLITAGLAVYGHFFAVLVLVSQWISVRCFAPKDAAERLRKLEWMTAAIASPGILYGLAHRGALNWVPPVDLAGVLGSATIFSGNSAFLMVAFALLVSFAIWRAAKIVTGSRRSLPAWNAGAPLCWLLFTPMFLLAMSVLKPVLVTRYLTLALPALVIVAATVLADLRPIAASALAIVLSVVLLRATLTGENFDQPRQDWRGAGRYVAAHVLPGDGAIFYHDLGRASFDWYWQQLGRGPQLVYTGRGTGFTSTAFHRRSESVLEAAKAAPAPRTWLLLTVPKLDPRAVFVRDHLALVYPHSCELQFDGITILLYGKGALDCGP